MKKGFVLVFLAAVLAGPGAAKPREEPAALGAGQRLRDAELEKLFLSVRADGCGCGR